MGIIQASSDITNLKDNEERFRYIKLFFESTTQQVNGNLEFGKNIKTVLINVTFSAANQNVTVSHNLGKIPTGYLVAGLTSALIVYDGSLPSNQTNITLRASAPGTARIMFY